MTTLCCDCNRHYLTYCNLCQQHTSCDHCGCYICNLKARENKPALDYTPDEERKILRTVSERTVNSRREQSQVRGRRRKKYANNRNLKEAWLDDFLAQR